MKKENTAGKTAMLSPEQEAKLIENTKCLATINKIIDRVSDKDAAVRFITFENGYGKIAVSSEPGRDCYDNNGRILETIHESQLFDLVLEYFRTRKTTLLEEICNIYQKGGDQ